jgi:1-acyl-sn-glycerol-3-phosphate acyltransferase
MNNRLSIILRSFAFNLLYFFWVSVPTFLFLWILLLPSRQFFVWVGGWQSFVGWLERHILGLQSRTIGWEHVPQGACIIAAKHQSAWETLRLNVLFFDPAIVLKQELTHVPVWGWYAWRCGMIPINRSGGAKALKRMMDAAHKAKDDGRKIVIFPQGTRVAPGVRKPYKSGVVALYKELELPIVPMAVNSGLFWPKGAFIKKPGVVTIEFLPPIPPGLPRAEMMARLEGELEGACARLAAEASLLT